VSVKAGPPAAESPGLWGAAPGRKVWPPHLPSLSTVPGSGTPGQERRLGRKPDKWIIANYHTLMISFQSKPVSDTPGQSNAIVVLRSYIIEFKAEENT